MTAIKKFVDAVATGNTEVMDTTFKSILMDRVRTHLDVKSVELASNTYSQSNKEDCDE